MKDKIHPTYYEDLTITCSCGNTIIAGSTKKEIRTEICSACHPFYTGQQKLVDTAGRVDKFLAKVKQAQKIKEKNVKVVDKELEEMFEEKPAAAKSSRILVEKEEPVKEMVQTRIEMPEAEVKKPAAVKAAPKAKPAVKPAVKPAPKPAPKAVQAVKKPIVKEVPKKAAAKPIAKPTAKKAAPKALPPKAKPVVKATKPAAKKGKK
jgi:large subunit ribosomal protein L31